MTTTQTPHEHPSPEELLAVWIELGRMALAGSLRLKDILWACETVILYSAWCRNGENKTRAAESYASSRRRVRQALTDWYECDRGTGLLVIVRHLGKSRQVEESSAP